MPPAVDRYELGPIATNCYVVRADTDASEAVVVDPGGDADRLRTELGRAGVTGLRDPRHPHALGPHRRRRGSRSGDRGAGLRRRRRGRWYSSGPEDFYATLGIDIPGRVPDVRLQGDETLDVAGLHFETMLVPGHSPAHLSFRAGSALFSGDVLFAGSVGGSTCPAATGTRC